MLLPLPVQHGGPHSVKRQENKINMGHKHLNQKLNFPLFMYNVITAEITVNYLCRKCKETYNTARTKKSRLCRFGSTRLVFKNQLYLGS